MREIRQSISNYGPDRGAEYDSGTMVIREDILPILRKLHSSKEYLATRTSPVINKLDQVWLISTIVGANLIDINRIHRNFFFDITSSDPIEEYIKVEHAPEREEVASALLRKIPSEVLPFCIKEGIQNYVPIAIELIERNFYAVDKIEMGIEEDPEMGEKWLLIDIATRGRVEDVIESYNRYTECWVSSVPWPERHRIRLSFNIV